MEYRQDKYGNRLSALGFGCMRFQRGVTGIDLAATEQQLLLGGGGLVRPLLSVASAGGDYLLQKKEKCPSGHFFCREARILLRICYGQAHIMQGKTKWWKGIFLPF